MLMLLYTLDLGFSPLVFKSLNNYYNYLHSLI